VHPPGLLERTVAGLRRLFAREIDAVILEGPDNQYVQFGRRDPGSPGVPLEAVSNINLPESRHLGSEQEGQLRERGFGAPLPPSHPASSWLPNWYRHAEEDEWELEDMARFAIDTLCSVYVVERDEVQVTLVENAAEPSLDSVRDSSRTTISLLDTERGGVSMHARVAITETGDLELEEQDIGEELERYFGRDEVESWITVSAEDKDKVLLLLMQEVFASDEPPGARFREWLEQREVPYRFSVY
jgi:hypothetical protein